jgi:hypothetical protein
MKVTNDRVLVDGRCPGCWKKKGQNHDKECITLNHREVKEEPQSEWLQDALETQRKHKAKRRPKPIVKPASTPPETSSNGKAKLLPGSRVEDVIQSVYNSVRAEYPGRKLQAIILDPEVEAGNHVWDIRGKNIPFDGELRCRVQVSRSNQVLGTAVFTLERRVVVKAEFLPA